MTKHTVKSSGCDVIYSPIFWLNNIRLKTFKAFSSRFIILTITYPLIKGTYLWFVYYVCSFSYFFNLLNILFLSTIRSVTFL